MNQMLWNSDLGNGMFQNPILFADYSDPDVIRVEETYYMTASSFNYVPGLPILTSKDLIHWELVNYAVKQLDPYNNGNQVDVIDYQIPAHSKGIWAPAIRYHEGLFYIYYGMPDDGIYVVTTDNPLGDWSEPHCVFPGKGYIDPCPFWDEDGKAYIIHGYAKSRIGFKSYLGIFELSWDGKTALGEDRFVFDGTLTQVTIEGPKVYKRDGYYYIFAPAGGVKHGWQTVLRSSQIEGPYEEKIVLMQMDTIINGPHQGALIDTPCKEEWFLHFQDKGAYGRIAHIQPVRWENGWPLIGVEQDESGCGKPVIKYQKPNTGYVSKPFYLQGSDDFQDATLNFMWQWIGNSSDDFYSLTEKPGQLRLYSKNPARDLNPTIYRSANVITQKFLCPCFRGTISCNPYFLAEGERAGITIFGGQYCFLNIKKMKDTYLLEYGISTGSGEIREEEILNQVELPSEFHESQTVFFKVIVSEDKGQANVKLWLSLNGEEPFGMIHEYTAVDDTWVGAKLGLFSLAGELEGRGHADFQFVTIEKGLLPEGFLAAENGDFEKVKWVVEYSKDSMNETDEEERTILHYGVKGGNLELVRYLVEWVGMDPCQADYHLVTPFDLAVSLKKTQIQKYFEERMQVLYEQMYHNPIRSGMYPDPSIVRVGEDYYMVNSTFLYFPSIPISHSKDLIHWKIIGHAIVDPAWSRLSKLECGRGYWAPDISYHNETFYITATYRKNDTEEPCREQMIVKSKQPEGPYSEPVIVEEDGIDPSLFWEDDGRLFMLLNRGARILELDPETFVRKGDATLLYYGDFKRAPEGPHVLKKDGYYYLFLAEGGTGILHQVTVSRATTLMGPYEPCPFNPIMTQKNTKAAIQRCGHGKAVSTQNGDWYMVYLCGRLMDKEYSVLGRETSLDPITWTSDGWPMVNRLKGPSGIQKNPLPVSMEHPSIQETIYTKGFMTVREPDKDAFLLKDQGIWIKGSKEEYDSMEARNILVKRRTLFQEHHQFKMQIPNLNEENCCGMIAYYDENSWFTFGLRQKNGNYYLELKQHIGLDTSVLENKTSFCEALKTGDLITFRIECDQLSYGLFVESETKQMEQVFYIPKATYLSDEGVAMGKRFTGTTIGVFAYGETLSVFFQEV